MKIADQMHDTLKKAFSPSHLDVVDESASHAGHAGNPSGDGETHFHVVMRAPAMAGMSRVARHRAVHSALGDLVARIHALTLDLDV
ncbi:BolA family protein [Celeribacter sp.]|uniref:BolA family protein n=1 Tax=Celeribacter sp. TaxID=1890673 RepID=UPI003A94B9A8